MDWPNFSYLSFQKGFSKNSPRLLQGCFAMEQRGAIPKNWGKNTPPPGPRTEGTPTSSDSGLIVIPNPKCPPPTQVVPNPRIPHPKLFPSRPKAAPKLPSTHISPTQVVPNRTEGTPTSSDSGLIVIRNPKCPPPTQVVFNPSIPHPKLFPSRPKAN